MPADALYALNAVDDVVTSTCRWDTAVVMTIEAAARLARGFVKGLTLFREVRPLSQRIVKNIVRLSWSRRDRRADKQAGRQTDRDLVSSRRE